MFFLRNIKAKILESPRCPHGQEGHTAGSCLGQGRTRGLSFQGQGVGTWDPVEKNTHGIHGEEQLEMQRCSGMDQGVPEKWELGEPGMAEHTAEGLWYGMRDLALSLLTPGWHLGWVCRSGVNFVVGFF